MMPFLQLVILAFIVSSCATKPIEQSKLEKLNDVGVVSVLDDQMNVKYAGSSALGNKELRADTSGWDVNKVISDKVKEDLTKLGKKTVTIQLDPQRIEEGKKEALSLKNIYLGNRYQAIQQYVLDEAAKQGAKYVFVIHPMMNENFPAYKPGYGFLCQTPAGKKGDLEIYFQLGAQLWNVQTKEIEARAVVTPADVAAKTGKPCSEAVKLQPNKLAANYKSQVEALARQSVEKILSGSGVITTSK